MTKESLFSGNGVYCVLV